MYGVGFRTASREDARQSNQSLARRIKRGPIEDQATTEIPKEVTAGQSARKEKGEGWQVAQAVG
jgi:hypothetical protein